MKIYEVLKHDRFGKPTPTVDEIAKKHGVSKEYIHDQLSKGIRVEYEHTNNSELASEIALDHLSELPDYYVRLRQVEK